MQLEEGKEYVARLWVEAEEAYAAFEVCETMNRRDNLLDSINIAKNGQIFNLIRKSLIIHATMTVARLFDSKRADRFCFDDFFKIYAAENCEQYRKAKELWENSQNSEAITRLRNARNNAVAHNLFEKYDQDSDKAIYRDILNGISLSQEILQHLAQSLKILTFNFNTPNSVWNDRCNVFCDRLAKAYEA